MARATVFHRDPASQARAFEQQGFEYLHIVDLDGAFAGKPMNAAAVDRILETVSIPVQLGGGVRNTATVESWLDKGVHSRRHWHCRSARSTLRQTGAPEIIPAALRWDSMRATAKWRSKVGRKPRNCRRSK